MKISFYIMACRCMSMTVSRVIKEQVDGMFILLDEVTELASLDQRYQWLSLHAEFEEQLKLKKSESISQIHNELDAQVKEFPELEGFDHMSGNPFAELIKLKGLSPTELAEKFGEDAVVLKVDAIEEVTDAVMNYNFSYKYKEQLLEFFKSAEDKMRILSKRDKWPGRGSWNAFVPKTERKKKEVNFDFLKLYGKRKKAA
jgi:hypothetical protein